MLMFSFNNEILLRAVHTRMLAKNAIGFEEIGEIQFGSIITPRNLDFRIELGFNIGTKAMKVCNTFDFCLRRKT